MSHDLFRPPLYRQRLPHHEIKRHSENAFQMARDKGYQAVRKVPERSKRVQPIRELYLHTGPQKSHFDQLIPFDVILQDLPYFAVDERTGVSKFKRPFFALADLSSPTQVNPFKLDNEMRAAARLDVDKRATGGPLRLVYLQAHRAEMERRLTETTEGRFIPLLESIRSVLRVLVLEAPVSKACPPPTTITKQMWSRVSRIRDRRHARDTSDTPWDDPFWNELLQDTWGNAAPLAKLYWDTRRLWILLARDGYRDQVIPQLRQMVTTHRIDNDLIEYQLTAVWNFGLSLREALRDAFAIAVKRDAADELLREELLTPSVAKPASPWSDRGKEYLRAVVDLEGTPFDNPTSFFSRIADLCPSADDEKVVSRNAPRRAFERAGFFAASQSLEDFRPSLEKEAQRVLAGQ